MRVSPRPGARAGALSPDSPESDADVEAEPSDRRGRQRGLRRPRPGESVDPSDLRSDASSWAEEDAAPAHAGQIGRGAIVLIWRDYTATGHLQIETLGDPPKEIVDADGVLLVKRK